MDYDEFMGQVQHRASLDSQGAAEKVTRVTLSTLAERIQPGEADDLAAQLPEEIGRHLLGVEEPESFSWDGFVERLVEREGLDPDEAADAVFHARAVMDVVADAISVGEMNDLRGQLPEEFDELFELVDQAEDYP